MLGAIQLAVVGTALYRLWDHPATWLWWALIGVVFVTWLFERTSQNIVRGTEDGYMNEASKRRVLGVYATIHFLSIVVGIGLGIYGHILA